MALLRHYMAIVNSKNWSDCSIMQATQLELPNLLQKTVTQMSTDFLYCLTARFCHVHSLPSSFIAPHFTNSLFHFLMSFGETRFPADVSDDAPPPRPTQPLPPVREIPSKSAPPKYIHQVLLKTISSHITDSALSCIALLTLCCGLESGGPCYGTSPTFSTKIGQSPETATDFDLPSFTSAAFNSAPLMLPADKMIVFFCFSRKSHQDRRTNLRPPFQWPPDSGSSHS